MNTQSPLLRAVAVVTTMLLAACAAPKFSQQGMPTAVQVPDGHAVSVESVGVGTITYECRAGHGKSEGKSDGKNKEKSGDSSGFEWVFVGPEAKLSDRSGKPIGRYYGPPATWESVDGSRVTGAQVAVAPTMAGNIPLQLVKANPATGRGSMAGVTFIQRVATKGGVPPAAACDGGVVGKKEVVNYQADYILYKAK
jgi:hypothetical protein